MGSLKKFTQRLISSTAKVKDAMAHHIILCKFSTHERYKYLFDAEMDRRNNFNSLLEGITSMTNSQSNEILTIFIGVEFNPNYIYIQNYMNNITYQEYNASLPEDPIDFYDKFQDIISYYFEFDNNNEVLFQNILSRNRFINYTTIISISSSIIITIILILISIMCCANCIMDHGNSW